MLIEGSGCSGSRGKDGEGIRGGTGDGGQDRKRVTEIHVVVVVDCNNESYFFKIPTVSGLEMKCKKDASCQKKKRKLQ